LAASNNDDICTLNSTAQGNDTDYISAFETC